MCLCSGSGDDDVDDDDDRQQREYDGISAFNEREAESYFKILFSILRSALQKLLKRLDGFFITINVVVGAISVNSWLLSWMALVDWLITVIVIWLYFGPPQI